MIPLNQIHIPKPCAENWDAMDGDAEERFCAGCGCHVHNLSALSRQEAQALLERTGAKLCVRFQPDTDGRPLTHEDLMPAPGGRRGFGRRWTAACSWVAALALAGCAQPPPVMGSPVSPKVVPPHSARTKPHHPAPPKPKTTRPPQTLGEVQVTLVPPLPPPLMGAPMPPPPVPSSPATMGKPIAPPKK